MKRTVLLLCSLVVLITMACASDPPNYYELGRDFDTLQEQNDQLYSEYSLYITGTFRGSNCYTQLTDQVKPYFSEFEETAGVFNGLMLFRGDLDSAHSALKELRALHHRYTKIFQNVIKEHCADVDRGEMVPPPTQRSSP